MELTFVAGISLVGTILGIYNIIVNRKDKAVKDTKEQNQELNNERTNQALIDYRLTKVEEKLDRIIDMFDNFEKDIKNEMTNMIKIAIEKHEMLYHSKKKKGE